MGRTLPTYTTALRMEYAHWKKFRDGLGRHDRLKFEQLLREAEFHKMPGMSAARMDPFEAMFMAILLRHQEELEELGCKTGGSPQDNPSGLLGEEVLGWDRFTMACRESERESFERMINAALENAIAMETKAEPIPVYSLLMGIMVGQQKLIDELRLRVSTVGGRMPLPTATSVEELHYHQKKNPKHDQAANVEGLCGFT